MTETYGTLWFIAGYSKSGKTTVGDLLTEITKGNHTTFAKAVKDDVARITGIERTLFETQTGKAATYVNGKTGRQLLIEHAAIEKERTGNPAYWAVKVGDEIAAAPSTADWILSDWRYKAEIEHICQRFPERRCITIHIERPGNIPSSSPSEHELDDETYDYNILNSGSLMYLGAQIQNIVWESNV
jgi:hypothetical protein